jgi:carbonic anhydrase/acetyltransferase-like protein (isoleucine patch superfamily)
MPAAMPIYTLKGREPRFDSADCFIAPTASVVGSVRFGAHSSVWFNVVVRADDELITIGERSNVQDGSVLHADPGRPLVLERNVTIGHKVMLHGCRVAEGSLIGMNAVLLNGARVGSGTIIGAGALVAEDKEIPSGVLAIGSPARVVRELTAEEREGLLKVAEIYVRRSARYRAELTPFQAA